MTTAGVSGAAAVDMQVEPQHSLFCLRLPRFSFHSKKRNEAVIQGQLRIRSLPGIFLIVGILVVVVGAGVAVAGYWPCRIQRAAAESMQMNGTRGALGRAVGPRSALPTVGLIHSNRMKLLGPIVMGVGLFIFICANTMLYENRDRETQLLLTQAAAAAAASPEGHLPALDVMLPQPSPWSVSHTATELNICCLEELELARSVSERLEVGAVGTGPADCGQSPPMFLTEALHHQESSSPQVSLNTAYSGSCNSSFVNGNMLGASLSSPPATPRAMSSAGTMALPLIKVINCPMGALPNVCRDDEWGVPALPRRAYSLSCRSSPREYLASVSQVEVVNKPVFLPEPRRKEFSSDVCLGTVVLIHREAKLGGALMKLENHSWPRLNFSSSRRYLKLENMENSREMLQDKMEE